MKENSYENNLLKETEGDFRKGWAFVLNHLFLIEALLSVPRVLPFPVCLIKEMK